MKKNMYLWIFISIAVILCGMFLAISRNNSIESKRDTSLNINSQSPVNSNAVESVNVESQEKVDLSQTDVDFEEDADDLSDGIVDESQFDEELDLNSIENEIY